MDLNSYFQFRRLAIFTGGSAWNNLVGMINGLTSDFVYVIPVSDDGGSTSEIIRVFGGPGLGDLRSRLIRLADVSTAQNKAIHDLLGFRLSNNAVESYQEWLSILSFDHFLWSNIDTPHRQNIATFLHAFQNRLITHFNGLTLPPPELELDVKTGLHFSTKFSTYSNDAIPFDFRHGSIGNFYLSGTAHFFKSLESALAQMSLVLSCPSLQGQPLVLPIISSDIQERVIPLLKRTRSINIPKLRNFDRIKSIPLHRSFSKCERALDLRRIVIAAKLRNGETVIGQCEISHPGNTVGDENTPTTSNRKSSLMGRSPAGYHMIEISHQPSMSLGHESALCVESISKSFPSLTACSSKLTVFTNLFFNKGARPLHSQIRRIHYVNKSHQETILALSPTVKQIMQSRTGVIYGIGSLYTSLLPCLIVSGIAHSIAALKDTYKILVLNGTLDRETTGFTALDFIFAITDALNYSWRNTEEEEYSETLVNEQERVYDISPHHPAIYMTHLIYLNKCELVVDVGRIERLGIKCVGVDSTASGLYDSDTLQTALRDILIENK